MAIKSIAGRWRVIKELGSGAVGQVLLAKGDDDDLVAVKLLNRSLTHGETKFHIEKFKSEFSILKNLSHPGINKVFDFGLDKELGQYFFTSEYVEGLDFLEAAAGLNIDQIEELFVQILRALEYLHSHGIIHCDIKSGNVLVSKNTRGIKIIDFGLAALGTPDQIVGTPSYMAPEIILKKEPDSRADLYSLGVLIYSVLTGINPFRTKDINETLRRHLNVTPYLPSMYNSKVKPYLDEVVMKLLEKSPTERFPTAAQVIRAVNFGGGKSYPVETRETFMGYLPAEGHLIGRREELKKIKDQCLKIKEGKVDAPFILNIEGEEGIGKKRLLSELKYFAQLNEMEVIELNSTDERSLYLFNSKLNELMDKLSQPAVIICHAGDQLVDKKAAQAVNLLRNIVKKIRFERTLSQTSDASKVLLAFASAPEGFLSPTAEDVNLIKLKNFNEQEVKEYLSVLTGIEDIPHQLIGELFSRTQGNPLFITEIVKSLVEKGALFDKVGRWNRDALEDIGVHIEQLKVPKTLSGILKRFYEKSSSEEKKILEVLSVWQRPVVLDEIENIIEITDLHGVLASLVRTGVVTFDAENKRYFFKNMSFQEVVYEEMVLSDRLSLHQKIADYIDKTAPESFVEIKWHRGMCGDLKVAVDSLLELAKYYFENSRPLDAVSVLNKAKIRPEGKDYRLDEVLLHLGEALVVSRHYEDAIDVYHQLLTRQEEIKTSRVVDKVLTCQKLGLVCLRSGDLKEAKKILEKAKDYLELTAGEEVLNLKVINLMARCHFLEGGLDLAEKLYSETKDRWRKLPDDDKRKVFNNDLAHVYLEKGDLELAEKELNYDIEFLTGIHEDSELERSYYALAELNRIKGKLDRAVEYFDKSIEIARKISDSEILLRAYNGLGGVFSAKEDISKSLYWYERGLDLAIRTGEDSTAAAIAVNIGLIKSQQGDFDQAMGHFKSAISIYEQASKRMPIDMNYLLRAKVELANISRTHFKTTRDVILSPPQADEACLPATRQGSHESTRRILLRLKAEKNDSRGFERSSREEEEISIFDKPDQEEKGDAMTLKRYQYILEINKYLSGETDPDFVLRTILKYAIELSGAQAGLVLLSGKEGQLEICSSSNVTVDAELSEISMNIANSAINKDEIVVTQDALTDQRFKMMKSVVILGLKSVMCIPVHARKKVIGVIYLENRARIEAFLNADKEVLSAFADQTGIAIENARLFAEHQKAKEKLRQELSDSSVQIEKLNAQVRVQGDDLRGRYQFGRLNSVSPKMRDIFDLLAKISVVELSVCITGESGTGKELIAHAIHYNSNRSKGPFVAVNCGAIPVMLIESELFGYKAGAFTGAVKDKMGFFEAAGGGTLFLDEIAELDPPLQAKLLRAIQEREVVRVGDTKPIKCDVRIIFATNKNLEELVKENKFREDLYYRIAEAKIDMPPLRERLEDIPLLIGEFISDYCKQHKIQKGPRADRSFISACMSYNWPGNIRELENAVRVAAALADKGKISVDSLPEKHVLKQGGEWEAAAKQSGKDFPLIDSVNRYDPSKTWKEYEAEIIAAAYRQNNLDARGASKHLKVALTTVYNKINRLGLKDKSNPLLATPFKYEMGTPFKSYVVRVFKSAWEYANRRPFQAIKNLRVSPGYFYRVMRNFEK